MHFRTPRHKWLHFRTPRCDPGDTGSAIILLVLLSPARHYYIGKVIVTTNINKDGPNMKKVLITGGAGFLGSHLCERFLGEGFYVICMDNFITGSPDNIAHLIGNPNFHFIHHDVTNFI